MCGVGSYMSNICVTLLILHGDVLIFICEILNLYMRMFVICRIMIYDWMHKFYVRIYQCLVKKKKAFVLI
jgi:hypothetical protein